ncbi:mobile mystery protein B [Fimbriimonas ginsengisoli]|uniref:Mobile mystery protein B n=1 Tax=Fimbriimonas ginsengisoli Gsoil 348 TaxID=661478 RepID=A0A068NT41_FIMGI|nr:mobile mystery protein B [Fimbriimonas ginsengisoli]AIE85940.1 mobile mystery protein B [Fimbriimonas ginsengisoli Gsoil 348]
MTFENPDGATPLDLDEAGALIPSLSTQAELNEFEFLNIAEAIDWAERSRKIKADLLRPDTLRLLHKRMFGRTWRWAGQYRTTQKSIGVEAFRISTELLNLTEDVKCWLEFGSYPRGEIAARFHHRLVVIHPFPNGNGRHARLATDLLCERERWPRSLWGAAEGVEPGEVRSRYLDSLRQADRHDLSALISFMGIDPAPG